MPSEQVTVLPPNSLIEVSIPGTGAHPFHLHGHTMDVIRETNNDTVNLINPPRRDVVPSTSSPLYFGGLYNNFYLFLQSTAVTPPSASSLVTLVPGSCIGTPRSSLYRRLFFVHMR